MLWTCIRPVSIFFSQTLTVRKIIPSGIFRVVVRKVIRSFGGRCRLHLPCSRISQARNQHWTGSRNQAIRNDFPTNTIHAFLVTLSVVTYCGIFAESQGTLLGDGTTNSSPRHRWRHSTMKLLRQALFSTPSEARRIVTVQWNTSHYVTHINRVAARSVFCGVRPQAI
jgi:ABC-type multidrug transport system permease subunit